MVAVEHHENVVCGFRGLRTHIAISKKFIPATYEILLDDILYRIVHCSKSRIIGTIVVTIFAQFIASTVKLLICSLLISNIPNQHARIIQLATLQTY
jgi:RecJ-like exonuclease